jgi:hypothetical protein
LVKIPIVTKDCCTYYYYPPPYQIYSFNNKTKKWSIASEIFKENYEDEINEFKDKLKLKNKGKIVKEKKNKASSQQVNSYKTKAKSNAKYIEESDNLDDLVVHPKMATLLREEKELARKSKVVNFIF